MPLWKAFHKGKSFLACAIGRQACLDGVATRYEQAPKFFPRLRQARGEGAYRREIERPARTPLFVLDDFGLVGLDAEDRVALLEVLEDRYARAATVIASQLPVGKWHEWHRTADYRRRGHGPPRPHPVHLRVERWVPEKTENGHMSHTCSYFVLPDRTAPKTSHEDCLQRIFSTQVIPGYPPF